MISEFLHNWREAPELGLFLDSCKNVYMYSEIEITILSRDLNINKGELKYRIKSRHNSTLSIGNGTRNYENI